MSLQQCTQHRNVIVIYSGLRCPVCSLLRCARDLADDKEHEPLTQKEAMAVLFEQIEEDSGFDLKS